MATFHWLPLQLCSAAWLTWLSYVDNGSLFQAGELIPSWLPLALGFCSSLKLDRFCYAQLHVLHGSLTWIMALCFKLGLFWISCSVFTFSSSPNLVPPPLVCDEGLAALTPIPEVGPCHMEAILNPLEAVTVEDCLNDHPLVAALLEEEQLDFSFSDDDGEDMLHSSPMPSPSGCVPPCSSGGPPHSSTKVAEEPVQDNESVLCDASAGWITVEPRRKANRKSPKGKEAITADMELNVTPSVSEDTVGSPSVRDSATDTVVTRPSSCRANPMPDANNPIDPQNRKHYKLLTLADNRRTCLHLFKTRSKPSKPNNAMGNKGSSQSAQQTLDPLQAEVEAVTGGWEVRVTNNNKDKEVTCSNKGKEVACPMDARVRGDESLTHPNTCNEGRTGSTVVLIRTEEQSCEDISAGCNVRTGDKVCNEATQKAAPLASPVVATRTVTAHHSSSPLWKSIILLKDKLLEDCGCQEEAVALLRQWNRGYMLRSSKDKLFMALFLFNFRCWLVDGNRSCMYMRKMNSVLVLMHFMWSGYVAAAWVMHGLVQAGFSVANICDASLMTGCCYMKKMNSVLFGCISRGCCELLCGINFKAGCEAGPSGYVAGCEAGPSGWL
ncbi:hypothetical protein POTOM_061612 [Populus tomentosa]|uniref:Uncharacterized protein n=1 Tax=Populus tomentosa TaxID=118781 RepID=A0A8X7XLY5_POPTO|nr:hypothetical protein POTOM_061612 [Populus tomentosa]